MYFLLAALLPHFRFLKHGLSLVLVLVGARMLLDGVVTVPTAWTLLLVCGILLLSVLASWLFPKRVSRQAEADVTASGAPAAEGQTETGTRVDFGSSASTNASTDSSS